MCRPSRSRSGRGAQKREGLLQLECIKDQGSPRGGYSTIPSGTAMLRVKTRNEGGVRGVFVGSGLGVVMRGRDAGGRRAAGPNPWGLGMPCSACRRPPSSVPRRSSILASPQSIDNKMRLATSTMLLALPVASAWMVTAPLSGRAVGHGTVCRSATLRMDDTVEPGFTAPEPQVRRTFRPPSRDPQPLPRPATRTLRARADQPANGRARLLAVHHQGDRRRRRRRQHAQPHGAGGEHGQSGPGSR